MMILILGDDYVDLQSACQFQGREQFLNKMVGGYDHNGDFLMEAQTEYTKICAL